MRVLFIAYHFGNIDTVAAKRVTYWASNINKLDSTITCDVITATKDTCLSDDQGINEVFYAPSDGNSWLSVFIKDEGVNWKNSLLYFLEKNKNLGSYDIVLLSGSPFMHFGINGWLRKKTNAKIILDFRDPFANNPRFNNRSIVKVIKNFFEKRFIANADLVLTVNDQCADLLSGSKDQIKIINNGYDEEIIDSLIQNRKHTDQISFFYLGTILWDRNPIPFLNALKATELGEFSFHHIGKNQHNDNLLDNKGFIFTHGTMNYADALKIVSELDVGVIFTSGKEFESTTKVFDYIGLQKPILIITQSNLKSGSLHKITEHYPNVYWTENNESSISQTLNKIKKEREIWSSLEFKEREQYSRKAGLVKLIKLLRQ